MKKNRLWLIPLLGIVVLLAVLANRFYFSKPTVFPKNSQLIKEINQVLPEAEAATIQDKIHIDKRHVFVPFISEEDKYGVSYWEWERSKWKPVSINTIGEPYVWKIDSDDPSSFRVVWNIHPDDRASYLTLYFIRERGFSSMAGEERYDPRIQLEKKVNVAEKSYGVVRLPDDWGTLINSYSKIKSVNTSPFGSSFPTDEMYFGWIPYDKKGKEVILNSSLNGHGFSTGEASIEFMRFLTTAEVESSMEQNN